MDQSQREGSGCIRQTSRFITSFSKKLQRHHEQATRFRSRSILITVYLFISPSVSFICHYPGLGFYNGKTLSCPPQHVCPPRIFVDLYIAFSSPLSLRIITDNTVRIRMERRGYGRRDDTVSSRREMSVFLLNSHDHSDQGDPLVSMVNCTAYHASHVSVRSSFMMQIAGLTTMCVCSYRGMGHSYVSCIRSYATF